MKSTLCIVLLVLLVATVCQAQHRPTKPRIEGRVSDQAGQPIMLVTITVSSSRGTYRGTTDNQGKYYIWVAASTGQTKYTVTPSKPGYIFDPASGSWEEYSSGPNFVGRKK